VGLQRGARDTDRNPPVSLRASAVSEDVAIARTPGLQSAERRPAVGRHRLALRTPVNLGRSRRYGRIRLHLDEHRFSEEGSRFVGEIAEGFAHDQASFCGLHDGALTATFASWILYRFPLSALAPATAAARHHRASRSDRVFPASACRPLRGPGTALHVQYDPSGGDPAARIFSATAAARGPVQALALADLANRALDSGSRRTRISVTISLG